MSRADGVDNRNPCYLIPFSDAETSRTIQPNQGPSSLPNFSLSFWTISVRFPRAGELLREGKGKLRLGTRAPGSSDRFGSAAEKRPHQQKRFAEAGLAPTPSLKKQI